MMTLRPFQDQIVHLALEKAQTGIKTLVADVHPGAGKTLAILAAADRLHAAGHIDAVVVLVPRLNLARQFEEDWNASRDRLPWPAHLGGIHHASNGGPLFFKGADGYITTYDSVLSNPDKHVTALAGRRFLLACDEAQQLGIDAGGGISTRSAEVVEQIGDMAAMIIVASGTPFRTDGNKLLFASYSEPDAEGRQRLLSDVRVSYRDGVEAGFLRPFEALLHDGSARVTEMGSAPKTMQLSTMGRPMHELIEHPDYWQPLVDRFLAHIAEQQQLVHPDLCGLIAATRQYHARDIMAYIEKKHPDTRALLAVSDEAEAHQALSAFRRGGYDVLVTVNMAYVGFDHKPINSILILTTYRTEGYLRQLLARGLRMWQKIEAGRQTCYAFAPDDLAMRAFTDKLRQESEVAVNARDTAPSRANGKERSGDDEQPAFMTVGDAELGEVHARGYHDVTLAPGQYEIAEQVRAALGIGAPVTALVAWARQVNPAFQIAGAPNGVAMQEQIREAKSTLRSWAARCDHKLFRGRHGATYGALVGIFGPTDNARSVAEIQTRIATVMRWIDQGYVDNGP